MNIVVSNFKLIFKKPLENANRSTVSESDIIKALEKQSEQEEQKQEI